MQGRMWLGGLSVGLGVAIALVAFVPFVAISIRRHGRLTLGHMLTWLAAVIYAVGVWAYTLLPLPDSNNMTCAGTNLRPMAVVEDIRHYGTATLAELARNPALAEFCLNVVLFVPLGFFVRLLAHRGFVVSTAVGFGASAFIELTQLTGVWWLYPCAYRVFDVDDLASNTIGALAGGLLSLLLPRHLRLGKPDVDTSKPQPVTFWRRLLGMAVDVLAYTWIVVGVAAAIEVWQVTISGHDPTDAGVRLAQLAARIAPLLVLGAIVLATGRTIGDWAVQLRFAVVRSAADDEGGAGQSPSPEAAPAFTARPGGVVRRLARFLGGIGGWGVAAIAAPGWAIWAFALAVIIITYATPDRRGLAGILSTQQVIDSRVPLSA